MNDNELQKRLARGKRGQVTAEFVKQFDTLSDLELISKITDPNSQIRTSAAVLLGQRSCKAAFPNLCLQLSCEDALYAKIAISNALSSIGVPALSELLKYVGKIGDNQHQTLPTDIFKKWSYPCPRDIAIRCIIRIGQPALADLNQYSRICNQTELSEIIDAIGHISFYEHDQSSFANLMMILEKYRDNNVITWKAIRALQAFPLPEAAEVLKDYLLHSNLPEHRWEAARSLGQIASNETEVYLKMAQEESDIRVKAMVELALKHINDLRRNKLGY